LSRKEPQRVREGALRVKEYEEYEEYEVRSRNNDS